MSDPLIIRPTSEPIPMPGEMHTEFNRSELDTARAIIAALTEDEGAALTYGEFGIVGWVCAYCESSHRFVEGVEHAPDCPILAGRKWLAANKAQSWDEWGQAGRADKEE